MVQVIGKENCGRCSVVKNILKSKGIEFEYKLKEEIEDSNSLISRASEAGVRSFPMIIKDGQFTDLQSV